MTTYTLSLNFIMADVFMQALIHTGPPHMQNKQIHNPTTITGTMYFMSFPSEPNPPKMPLKKPPMLLKAPPNHPPTLPKKPRDDFVTLNLVGLTQNLPVFSIQSTPPSALHCKIVIEKSVFSIVLLFLSENSYF